MPRPAASRRRSSLDRGEWVFVEDAAEAWVLGKVESRGDGSVAREAEARIANCGRTSELSAVGAAKFRLAADQFEA